MNFIHSRVVARSFASNNSFCPECSFALYFKRLQFRSASTARRHKKLLNVAPAPSFGGPTSITGGSGRSRTPPSLPGQDYIVFNPPPSTPNVYHTPLKFLPRDDPRRALYVRSSSNRRSSESTALMDADVLSISSSPIDSNKTLANSDTLYYTQTPTRLPPPVHQPYKKSYHLREEDITQIRQLRQEDEQYWTREKLAAKFKCSTLFIGMIVQASEGRLKALKTQENNVRNAWGTKRTLAREDRARRRELWQRDE